jgi:UDP-N-acetylglucosamine 2-epimerase (non-hydrolysing)
VIHFVVGTRAQLFKMAPVMLECEERGLNWRWVYTAQHRDTIDQTVQTFGLPPPHCVVVKWQSEAKSMRKVWYWFARMLLSLARSRSLLAGQTGSEHIVLTHGDTLTTWLAALMGKLTRTPVMHVESGLRSFDLRRPFPEEINRLITFRLADHYACPGDWASENLKRYRGPKLNTVVNTQVDTLRFGLERLTEVELPLPAGKYVVASIHRYENIFRPERLDLIVRLLERIAREFHVLFIQHPATQLQLQKRSFRKRLEGNEQVSLLPRLEYLPFIRAVVGSEFVVTDGGGNQEELAYLGKPTLIMRERTERREGLGENAVVSGLDESVISRFVEDYRAFERPQRLPSHSPSGAIVDYLVEHGFAGISERRVGPSSGAPGEVSY